MSEPGWADRIGVRLLSIKAGFWTVVAWPVRVWAAGWHQVRARVIRAGWVRARWARVRSSGPVAPPEAQRPLVRPHPCRAKMPVGMRVACTAGRLDAARRDLARRDPELPDAGRDDPARRDAGRPDADAVRHEPEVTEAAVLPDPVDRRLGHPSVRSAPAVGRRMVSPFGQGPGRAPQRGSSRPSNRISR